MVGDYSSILPSAPSASPMLLPVQWGSHLGPTTGMEDSSMQYDSMSSLEVSLAHLPPHPPFPVESCREVRGQMVCTWHM